MNANLILNEVSNSLGRNKLRELAKFLLELPWEVKGDHKALTAKHVHATWRETTEGEGRWCRFIEMRVGDYWMMFSTFETNIPKDYHHRFSWKLKREPIAKVKEW